MKPFNKALFTKQNLKMNIGIPWFIKILNYVLNVSNNGDVGYLGVYNMIHEE